MTALEYLDRLRGELAELERLVGPADFRRFTSDRTAVRRRVETLRLMAGWAAAADGAGMSAPLFDIKAASDYSFETDAMADDLWRYVFPPWRWAKWWRLHREVRRRLKSSREARRWRAEHWDQVVAFHMAEPDRE